MSINYTEIEKWDKKLCKLPKTYGLDWYPINYEICDYYSMIGNITYVGMPAHYQHWSFGKSFERTHFFYNQGQQGLPYEMIINSNPSISYLMRENPMPMHVLTMAHCIGHSDFFKNNRMFKKTDPENIISRFKNAANRIRRYIEDPSIGVEGVERILDAAHSIKYQCNRNPDSNKLSHEKLKEYYIDLIKNDTTNKYKNFNIEKVPLENDYDILEFIKNNGRFLQEWERDLINIVIEETKYFIPQAKTKIMNEGWASFWHYKLLNELELPQEYHLHFIKSHNQVIRPHVGSLNPYHIGFSLFTEIEKEKGLDECFFARENFHDEQFILTYLNKELCRELNLYSYSKRPKKRQWVVDEISDDDGWKMVRNDLISNIGLNSIPKIYACEVGKDNILHLEHEYDSRDLDIDYAYKVIDYVKQLWGDEVNLITTLEEEPFEF